MWTIIKKRHLIFLIPSFIVIVLSTITYAQPMPGDALVVDSNAGTSNRGALFSVNLTTGARTIISDFGVGAVNFERDPFSIALDDSGNALVFDPAAGTFGGAGALFSVNLTTGARTLISNFSVGSNLGVFPSGITIDGTGNALVADADGGTNNRGRLLRVDLTTGARTLISDFGVGPNMGSNPVGVALDGSGYALVIDPDSGTNFQGALFSVDITPGSTFGDRTLISDFGVGLNPGNDPVRVALDGFGNALVVDGNAPTPTAPAGGALFSVNLTTGARTIISDFGEVENIGGGPFGVALDGSGNALVTDTFAGTNARGALFSVDITPGPTFGDRTLISDFGVGLNMGSNIFGVAFIPIEDIDTDSDGIPDHTDLCPDTGFVLIDANGCSDAQVDFDLDVICDPDAPSSGPSGCTGSDNCPTVFNPLQTDVNGDGFGDDCVDPNTNINDNADIAADVIIGSGTQINRGVTVESGVMIGENVVLNRDSEVGENTEIGDNTVINRDVTIGSDAVIGENVTIGRNVTIGDGVTIGDNTMINQGTVIENDATIGMNVVLGRDVTVQATANVPDGTVVPKNTVVTP